MLRRAPHPLVRRHARVEEPAALARQVGLHGAERRGTRRVAEVRDVIRVVLVHQRLEVRRVSRRVPDDRHGRERRPGVLDQQAHCRERAALRGQVQG